MVHSQTETDIDYQILLLSNVYMLAVLSVTDCSSWKYFKVSFTALEFTLTLPQGLQPNRSGTLNLRDWLNKQILKRHQYNLKSVEILKMCADETWAGGKYWATKCCEEAVPMETHGTAACTWWLSFARTNQGDSPSVPFIIQDTYAKTGVIRLKILILCKVG